MNSFVKFVKKEIVLLISVLLAVTTSILGKTSPKKENIEHLRSRLAADLSSDLNKPDIRKSTLKSSLKSGLSKKK